MRGEFNWVKREEEKSSKAPFVYQHAAGLFQLDKKRNPEMFYRSLLVYG